MLDASAAAKQRQAAGDLSADEAREIFKNEGRIVPLAQVSGRPENGLRVRLTDGTILRAWEGHLYSCRDEDAGFRSYEGKQGWLGYMHVKAVDVATGLPVAQLAVSASVQEFKVLPDIYDHAVQATGINPIAVGADRGYGFREVYEFLARNDSGAVIPYRMPNGQSPSAPEETKYSDMHGVPKCPGCEEPGDIIKTGQERIWFTCALAPLPECDGIHSVSTKKDPLNLVLVPRTGTAYGAVRAAVQTNEQAHQFMREHFAVGGKTLSDRLRRTGLAPSSCGPTRRWQSPGSWRCVGSDGSIARAKRASLLRPPRCRLVATRRASAQRGARSRCSEVQRPRVALHPNAPPPSSTRASRGVQAPAQRRAFRPFRPWAPGHLPPARLL